MILEQNITFKSNQKDFDSKKVKKKHTFLQYFLLPFRVVYKVYFLLFFSISLTILFPFFYYLLYNPKRFPKAFVLMKMHAYILLIFAGAQLNVKGLGFIPKNGPFIICPNHSSFLDIFCIYSIFKRYFVFTGKKEIEKWPLFHIFYTSGMNILVDRHNKIGTVKALKRMINEIDLGNPLVIFPEGTISKKAPEMGPFKQGAFALAIQKQIPILPVTFVTNWKRLQRGHFFTGLAGPGVAKVVIHKPIQTAGLKKEDVDWLQSQVYDVINGSLLKSRC